MPHANYGLVLVGMKETFKKKIHVPCCSDKQIVAIKGQETWQRQIKHLTFSLYMPLSVPLSLSLSVQLIISKLVLSFFLSFFLSVSLCLCHLLSL